MYRKLFLFSFLSLTLTSCARLEEWMNQEETELPVFHFELTEEQLEQFNPEEYSEYEGRINITIIEETDEEPEEQDEEEQEEELSEEEQEQRDLVEDLPEEADLEDWELLLVNNENPLPDDFEVNMQEVDNEQQIDERIVEQWEAWRDAAQEAGHQLFFASGYRSVDRQQANYDRSVQSYIDEGYSEEEAIELTEEYIAIPNHSEHHTGLALDIVDQEWIAEGRGLEPEYDTQDSQHWLVETGPEYGFILRYLEGKEDITGINYESWHFRYVGEENARFMVEHDLVLEEYIELLELREEWSQDNED